MSTTEADPSVPEELEPNNEPTDEAEEPGEPSDETEAGASDEAEPEKPAPRRNVRKLVAVSKADLAEWHRVRVEAQAAMRDAMPGGIFVVAAEPTGTEPAVYVGAAKNDLTPRQRHALEGAVMHLQVLFSGPPTIEWEDGKRVTRQRTKAATRAAEPGESEPGADEVALTHEPHSGL